MGYLFRAKDGLCPECIAFGRKWFIMDRNIYGHYEFSLFSIPIEKPPIYQFRDLKEVVCWLNDFDSLSVKEEPLLNYYLRRWIVADYYYLALIEKNGVQYRYDKGSFSLSMLPERHQETGWFSGYRECIREAKAILRKIESGLDKMR